MRPNQGTICKQLIDQMRASNTAQNNAMTENLRSCATGASAGVLGACR